MSSEAIDMIKHLLTLDPGKRISTSAALDHPWMKDSDVIAKAQKLMGGNSGCGLPRKEAMPPPNLPTVSLVIIYTLFQCQYRNSETRVCITQ